MFGRMEVVVLAAFLVGGGDSPVVDDAGKAVAAFEGGARRIRSNDPVKLWNAIVPLVDAMNGEQAGRYDIIHRQ